MSKQNAVALLMGVGWLSLCIGMGGCATPYQPQGFRGGYSEVRLSDDAYLIRVNGNAYSSEALLWSYLQRRAQEVCVEHGFSSWRLEQPGSQSYSARSESGYDVERTSPSTLTVRERGFRYNKHQVEAVAVCGSESPKRRPAERQKRGEDGAEQSPLLEVDPAEPLK